MKINAQFAGTATAGEMAAVNTAIDYIDSHFAVNTDVTYNMTFGTADLGQGAVAQTFTHYDSVSYSAFETALAARDNAVGSSAAQHTAAGSLSATDPSNGTGKFYISQNEARLLGLDNSTSSFSETTINLNNTLSYTYGSAGGSTGGTIAPNTYDAVGALEHEITEAMGRTAFGGRNIFNDGGNDYGALDLFRYTAAGGGTSVKAAGSTVGQRAFSAQGFNGTDQTYFSLDGQHVELPYDTATDVANGADVADWAFPDEGGPSNDSFGAAAPGQPGLISQSDIDEMEALGYTFALCFASGTRIRTARGDVAVEALVVGDQAVTVSGALRPIRWLGHRTMTRGGRARPIDMMPVRIAAHAFGIGLPERDVFLSPGHPVLVDADADGAGGHLVPVMCLINGTTIERISVDAVTYWHVELDAHDILLADGLPAESYLEGGDRAFFTEAADHALANPDFVVPGLAGRCRPVAIDGPVVEAERRRLDMVLAMRLDAACAWPVEGAALFL